MQLGNLTLKRCRYGWMLFYGEHIGKCFDLYGEYSEAEVEVMRTFIRPGDTVIDVGANIGDLTLPLAAMVGREGSVYAYESHPDIFNILCGNMALNQIAHVYPINAFVKKSPNATVHEQFGRKGHAHKFITIDELGLKQCRLIKIDVDGNELDVLHSAEDTVNRLRPIIYLENDVRDFSRALLEYLISLNYELYWHVAPIFAPDNFFGNPVNHWAPNNIVSLMMLALPREQGFTVSGLPPVKNADDWVL